MRGKPTTVYKCTFSGVGRPERPDPQPLVTAVADANELAEKVTHHVRPLLVSRDVSVVVHLGRLARNGRIFAGLRPAGEFRIEDVTPQAAHDCGLCDSPLRFDGFDDGVAGWVCTDAECGWWHTSRDCCDETGAARR